MFILAIGKIAMIVVISVNLRVLTNMIEEWVDISFEQHGQEVDGTFRALEYLVSISIFKNY